MLMISYKFPFHKGSIDTVIAESLSVKVTNFNSIKVRLILGNIQAGQGQSFAFQFHKGSIDTLDYLPLNYY